MKKIQLSLLLLVVSVFADAQHNSDYWKFFSGTGYVREMEADGDSIWVAGGESAGGGLTCITASNGNIMNLNATNTNMNTNQVCKITIAPNHIRYLGTNDGIYKYEGTEIHQLYPNSVNSNNQIPINNIEVDANNNVWFTRIVNYNIGKYELIKYDGQTFTVYDSLNSNLPNNEIRLLKKDRQGNLYLIADYSIMKYDGTNWQLIDSSNSNLSGGSIYRNFCIDANGHFWITYYTGNTYGIQYFNGSTWTFFNNTNSPLDSTTGQSSISADDSGNVYIAQHNLLKSDGVNWTVIDSSNSPYISNSLLFAEIDPSGNLWYYDGQYGFMKYDFSAYTHFTTTNYPNTGDFYQEIAVGKNNELWFGTGYGFTKYCDSIWSNQPAFNPRTSDNQGMCVDTNNIFWGSLSYPYPSPSGPLLVYNQDTTWGFSNYTYADWSSALVCDKLNNKWFAQPFINSLSKYNGSTLVNYSTSNSPLISAEVDWMFVDHTNKLWISEYGGTYLQTFDGTNWQTINKSSLGFTSPSWLTMAENNQNTIYMASYNYTSGLLEIGKFNGITCTIVNSTTVPYYSRILFDKYDNLWLWVYGSGISKYYEGSWLNYNVYNSDIPTNYVRDVKVDNYNNIWGVGPYSGIFVFNENGLNFTTPVPKRMAVTGKCFFDVDSNGIKTTNEPYLLGQNIIETNNSLSTSSNTDGSYQFNLMQGNFTIAAAPCTGWRVSTDSLSYHINVNDSTINDSLDFGLTAPLFHRLSVDLNGALAHCGFTVPYWLHYVNTGTAIDSGIVSLTLDTSSVFVNAIPSPDSVVNNSLFWHYSNLGPYQQQTIYINAGIYNAGLDSMYVGGSFITNSCSISYNDGVTNNLMAGDTLVQEILCAYDPNDKSVIPAGVDSLHAIHNMDTLDYTIRFQNTGNDTAFFAKVIDTLSTHLEPTSLQIISSSHPYIYTNDNGVLTFNFANCNLPDSATNYTASNGYIRFKIAQKNANPDGTLIENTAHIVFNYNRSISTNTVFNTVMTNITTSIEDVNAKDEVLLFPNPTHDKVTVVYPNLKHQQSTITLSNMLGQQLYKITNYSEKTVLFNVNLSGGIYHIEITCGDKSYFKKLVVD
jgi:uncharacterized repeat protein (TIGR01451 family)